MERIVSVAALNKQQSWAAFVQWCETNRLRAAPAHPWTLAAYVCTLEGKMRIDAIRRHVGQIGQMHHEKLRKRPDRHPLVLRTIESLRRRADVKKRADTPPPLFRDEDFTDATPAPTRRKSKAAEAVARGLRATPKLVRRKRV